MVADGDRHGGPPRLRLGGHGPGRGDVERESHATGGGPGASGAPGGFAGGEAGERSFGEFGVGGLIRKKYISGINDSFICAVDF